MIGFPEYRGNDGSTASGNAGGRTIDQQARKLATASDGHEDACPVLAQGPTCRGIRPQCIETRNQAPVCADCQFLHEQHLGTVADEDFLRHCRAIREYVDQGVSTLFSPYVAALLVGKNGRILDIDKRSANYLRSSCVLGIQHNRLFAHEYNDNELLSHAIERVSAGGKPETLICADGGSSDARYSILLQPSLGRSAVAPSSPLQVACLIFPLGRRRVASAQQLISMFGLSPAEARLARALCHGETLEEYAEAEGVKLPTVKTQLRAVFAKTRTDRQVALVNLISGIPPLR